MAGMDCFLPQQTYNYIKLAGYKLWLCGMSKTQFIKGHLLLQWYIIIVVAFPFNEITISMLIVTAIVSSVGYTAFLMTMLIPPIKSNWLFPNQSHRPRNVSHCKLCSLSMNFIVTSEWHCHCLESAGFNPRLPRACNCYSPVIVLFSSEDTFQAGRFTLISL